MPATILQAVRIRHKSPPQTAKRQRYRRHKTTPRPWPPSSMGHADERYSHLKGTAVSAVPLSFLPLINEVPAAVLLPASFVAFGAERFFFAVADRLDAAGIYSARRECILH